MYTVFNFPLKYYICLQAQIFHKIRTLSFGSKLIRRSYKYRKIPIISPGLIFVQKAFLLGLFSQGLIVAVEPRYNDLR